MEVPPQPLVSIIIPVFNCETYIAQAIESALAQDWENKEIIIVDDGSTDGSPEIINRYKPHITVIHQENRGACNARNAGLRHARGDFIQYLDQDDMLHPAKISTQMRDILADPPGTLGCGRFFTIKESTADATHFDFFDNLPQYTSPVEWLIWSFEGRSMQSSVWLVPRHIHEKAGEWNEDLKSNPNDDGELFCRIVLASSRVNFSSEAITYFRMHDGPRGSLANDKTKITSLLRSLELCANYLLAVEDSRRTRHAIACTLKHFAHIHCLSAPDLADRALKRINELGFKRVNYNIVGGRAFRLVDKTVGISSAIKFKAIMNSIQHRVRRKVYR